MINKDDKLFLRLLKNATDQRITFHCVHHGRVTRCTRGQGPAPPVNNVKGELYVNMIALEINI